jgi:CRISPR system Cascade subunit CasA
VQGQNGVRLIGFERLLCSEEAFTLCLPRDDMEMSTLQLAICLAQVAVMPENLKELKDCIRQPMDETEYRQRTERLVPWFQLDHPEWPFMQIMEGNGKVTNIQKLLPGLPEGDSSVCFFNSPKEVRRLGAPMAAVCLFQQASTAPSFGGGPGGGFKAPLRGSAPITTLVWNSNLRHMLWHNVLCRTEVLKCIPNYCAENEEEMPVWVRPILRDSEVRANQIGLLRGLFWQPAHIKMLWQTSNECCDLVGIPSMLNCSEFNKEPFGYKLKNYWAHPHSPRELILRKGQAELEERALSFRIQEPAWTNCHVYAYRFENENKTGYTPAAVVSQFSKLPSNKKLNLSIGGYCNNQAKIEQRRHELISLGEGWDAKDADWLKSLIEGVLEAKDIMHKKLLWMKKADKLKKQRGIGVSLTDEAANLFFQRTEPIVRQFMQTYTTLQDIKILKLETMEAVKKVCMQIFEDVTRPFWHDPGIMAAVVVCRFSLERALNELIIPSAKKNRKKEVKNSVSTNK